MRYLLPLLLIFALPVKAQTLYLQRSVPWSYPDTTAKVMSFKEISSFVRSDYENYHSLLPRYTEIIEWQSENPEVEVSFYRAEYQVVQPDNEAKQLLSGLSDSISVKSHISFDSGKPYLQIALVPFRKNPVTGFIERLTSFVLKVESTQVVPKKPAPVAYKKSSSAENSMLSSGNWYKIRIRETGIYKLTYDQLLSLGLSDPANVRIYGWGGICLPDDVTKGEQDDLQAVQLYMNKGQDGIFNAGDYILFYGSGPVTWKYDNRDSLFLHDLNPYSDYGFYFVTSDFGASLQPASEPLPEGQVIRSTDTYDARVYHETEEVNVLKLGEGLGSGREWYGEDFETTPQRSFSFSIPGIVSNEPARFKTNVIGRSRDTCSFIISANNAILDTVFIRATNLSDYTATYAFAGEPVLSFKPTGDDIQLKYRFVKADNDSKGFLDYISLTARARLEMNGNILMFRDSRGVNDSTATTFTLGNADQNTIVWDVTDIHDVRKVSGNLAGGILSFTVDTKTTQGICGLRSCCSLSGTKI